MIKEIDSEFYNKFPRVYPTAETFGFNQEDIEKMINILKNDDCCPSIYSEAMFELVIKMIFVRLNLQRDDFYKYINQLHNILYWNKRDFERALDIVGKQSYMAYLAIVANRDKLMK
jgi:uncharacterized protein (DUF1919 family)